MKQLHNYIIKHSNTPISDQDFEIIMSHFIHKKFRRKQYFLQEGQVCTHLAFVIKGAMRQYFIDDKGIEHFMNLSIENWWVGDRESWAMHTPSIYNIDASEDSELLLISRSDILKLTQLFPAFNEMVRGMDERSNIESQKRIVSAISFNAERRYSEFTNDYPDLLKRFPHYIIASYIGITKETLSRVRNQYHQKQVLNVNTGNI